MADATVPDAVMAMTASLAHRGPDDEGYLSWAGTGSVHLGRRPVEGGARVVFGHRRLAIIDTSAAGWQPMRSSCGRFHLVFNGEVFNHVELREELAALGYRFATRTDTEVLLAAWQQWGESSLQRLVGMFAFALLDTAARRIILARDPFGIKPLYFISRQGRTTFASEIAPLLALPWARRVADAQSVFDYLRFGVPRRPDATFFADVRAVPAAHVLEVGLDAPDAPPVARRYWSPVVRTESDLTFAEAATRLRDLLVESVRLHLRSDVPVGAALSGGVDSSAILMLLRRAGGGSVTAFGYAADGALDESRWFERVAAAAGVPLRTVRTDGAALAAALDRLLTVQGEPFGSTSVFAQYRIFQEASHAGVRVMLGGQGADELFAGYRPYLAVRLSTLLRRGRPGDAVRLWTRARRLPGVDRLLVRAGGELLPEGAQRTARAAVTGGGWPSWLDRDWFERAGVDTAPPIPPRGNGGRLKDRMVDALQSTVLPALLRYEDRNAMAFSIENRVPFLTTAIADFALSLPDDYLIDTGGRSKAVLRAAMRGIVPDEILDRKDKVAFATPERAWLSSAGDWVERTLAKAQDGRVGGLRIDAVRRLFAAADAGPSVTHVFRAVSLIRWAQLADVEFV